MSTTRCCLVLLGFILLFSFASAQTPQRAMFSRTPITGVSSSLFGFTESSTGLVSDVGEESYTDAWILQNASSGWTSRSAHALVAMPDGSIVLMGGWTLPGVVNDSWRSTDKGVTWKLMNPKSAWSARSYPGSVAMPDGSIVLMGGSASRGYKNDTWRSTDNGVTWTLQNASSGWSARYYANTVAMPDGSILLMGGRDSISDMNDTWRSTDNGVTWTLQNASSGWFRRIASSAVAMPDGSIVLMSGKTTPKTLYNDVWRSTDKGVSWTLMNTSAEWTKRDAASAVAMPDGSILLMGGWTYLNTWFANDTWRSTDNGATWTLLNASSGWQDRESPRSVVLPDGSIVLTGGWRNGVFYNDTWRFIPKGSSTRVPSNTLTTDGSGRSLGSRTGRTGTGSGKPGLAVDPTLTFVALGLTIAFVGYRIRK